MIPAQVCAEGLQRGGWIGSCGGGCNCWQDRPCLCRGVGCPPAEEHRPILPPRLQEATLAGHLNRERAGAHSRAHLPCGNEQTSLWTAGPCTQGRSLVMRRILASERAALGTRHEGTPNAAACTARRPAVAAPPPPFSPPPAAPSSTVPAPFPSSLPPPQPPAAAER